MTTEKKEKIKAFAKSHPEYSAWDMAKIFNVAQGNVWSLLKRAGIKFREVEWKKKKKIPEPKGDYFRWKDFKDGVI